MTAATAKPKSKKIAQYIDRLPPCNSVCPAGENIQAWLTLVQQQKYKEAWESLVLNNPLPAIHGRICYHPCETKCNRALFDSTVSIRCVERFLGDMALTEGWKFTPGKSTGKKVLIIGAGPAGLSAAYHLRLLGHEVTILEALSQPGGTMLVGIPAYRLPREVLRGEVQRILDMGVTIKYNHKVTDIITEKEEGKFDAIFLAVGATVGKSLEFPADNPCPILDAVEYLRSVAINTPPQLGSKVVVYGGGNTAIDVARTAIRLGAKDVNVVYHRTRQKMPAFAVEVEEAMHEGVKFHFLRTLARVDGNVLTLNVNELDENGAPKATGKTEALEADAIVLALSQVIDSSFLRHVPGIELGSGSTILVDECMMTGRLGVFAGGDVVPYERSVTIAVGHGRLAARHINAYLNGITYTKPLKHEKAAFEYLRIDANKSQKAEVEFLDVATRMQSFVETTRGIDKNTALEESKRCFSCGNCFECDGCYEVCPVNAITKLGLGKRYAVDIDACIGCGKCVKRCPCGAIIMVDRNKN